MFLKVGKYYLTSLCVTVPVSNIYMLNTFKPYCFKDNTINNNTVGISFLATLVGITYPMLVPRYIYINYLKK